MLLYCKTCPNFTFSSSYFLNPCEDSRFIFFSGGNGYYGSPSNTAATGVANQGNNGGIAYNNGWPFLAGGGGGAAGAGVAGTSSECFL